ncbi:hypothetical protein L915_01616 [Phytophthora nicotianae]|uniref:Uncharacterized protein n=2 Tax=Phytophthora nicotianae TaxID=4792 RepID=W2QR39_PHYN3|nr:hypothetical protein PPTG_21964 [Phytophthora nicotianae INRA-310]ETK95451.1 hypothetical protein L915_01616 [Phytophthora nicotianae]ETL48840.1 hypothetical protein L916_01592 [Phytophthora nicotianae]ETN15578.1 hypothetical protein PPTG_21964 [Phytophthora nicotianae INRA-310]
MSSLSRSRLDIIILYNKPRKLAASSCYTTVKDLRRGHDATKLLTCTT